MPKYLQYKDQKGYWEWPEDSMIVYNVHDGHHKIDENSPAFLEGTVVWAENWRDLWKKTGWNPLSTNKLEGEMWIAPDGTMYGCGSWGAHEATAQDILSVIYNEDEGFFDCGDRLIARGWIKLTAVYVMYQFYEEAGYYDNMTDEQWNVHRKWKEKYL